MILDILFKCEKSLQAVKLCTIKIPCEQHMYIQGNIECSDVLSRPLESQATAMEKKMASNVVTRLLHQNNDTVVTLPTGGQVGN